MNYKLTIEQASIKNIVKRLMESYRGTDLFRDVSEAIKEVIRNEYFLYYGRKQKGFDIIENLSKKYGVSKGFIKTVIYGSNYRKR